ncbi:galactosamine-6-phosphate isomerase [Flagellimonas iocasae]|uniref:Galactosamine-6-phosphate isomerase n=1 Tax=Flagellimonas iocasae TaxID=2055905 RepID=A0ABW4Y237_9FLAO
MNNLSFDNYGEMSAYAGHMVLSELKKKKDLRICAATGNSPTGTYEFLARQYLNQQELFKELQIVKLDEWGGLPNTHPGSCEYYLQEHLLKPLDISNNRYTGFGTNPQNARQECERIQQKIENDGSIDLCILGLGKNGHIGFNEPYHHLQPFCHVAQLTEASQKHGMVKDLNQKPSFGMTLGMQNILSAKKIILLVYGPGKEEAISILKEKIITPQLPASFLWLHPNVDCLSVKNS